MELLRDYYYLSLNVALSLVSLYNVTLVSCNTLCDWSNARRVTHTFSYK